MAQLDYTRWPGILVKAYCSIKQPVQSQGTCWTGFVLQWKILHLQHSLFQESLGVVLELACMNELTPLEGQSRQRSLVQSYLMTSAGVLEFPSLERL